MNKIVYRIMNIIVAAALMLGGYSNVSAQSINPPSVPVLASPVNNTLVANLTPLLDWNDSSVPAGTTFQKYELQLAINNTFPAPTIIDISGAVSNSEYTPSVNLTASKTYYWRVRTYNTLGEYSVWSSLGTFMTPSLSTATPAPTNTSIPSTATLMPTNTSIPPTATLMPTNTSVPPTVTSSVPSAPSVPVLAAPVNNMAVTSLTPRFDWSNSNVPAGTTFQKYELQLAVNSNFPAPTIVNVSGAATNSEYTPGTNLTANKTYYWRVRAYNTLGQVSAWSAVWKMMTPSLTKATSTPANTSVPPTATLMPTNTSIPPTVTLMPTNTSIPATVTPALISPSAPVLAAPINNTLVTNLTPRFDWSDSSVPAGTTFQKYELQLAVNNTFPAPTIVDISGAATNSEYTPSVSLTASSTYYWRVRAYNTLGQVSDWSAMGTIMTPVSATATPAVISGDYFVSPTGNDANTGSQTQPWLTIQKAANTAPVGSTVTVLAGTYAERVNISRSITLQAQGQVVMRGFTIISNNVTIRGFEITDTPNDDTAGWGIYVRGSSCVLENNYVHYATRGGIYLFAQDGSEAQTTNCIVRNNRLYRNSQLGIQVTGMNHLVEGNEIWGTIQYHPKWINPPSYVDADGIRFFGSGHTFRGNYIHDITLSDPENVNPHIDAFQTWDEDVLKAGNNCLFEKNKIILGYDTAGFQLAGAAHDLTIRNNIIQAFAGIRAYKRSASPYTSPSNLFVLNNLFIGNLTDTNWPVGVTIADTTNVVVKNNIFYNQADYVIDIANSTGIDVKNNLAYNSNGSVPKSPIGAPMLTNLWNINPLFVNAGAGNYHLQAGSPAINAGVSLSNVTDDFEGTVRPQGTGYDIGPYEYK